MQKLIGKMARMYPLFILMGFMIVVTAFVVGYQEPPESPPLSFDPRN